MSLEKIARNPHGDALYDVIGPLAHRITSPHHEVWADQSQYERLIRGEKTGSLRTYSLLKPSAFKGFAGVLVASACMPDTMFHRLFTAQGIVFKPAKSLAQDLRYLAHEHGDRITILYAGEEPWSKRYRDRKLEGQDATVLDQVKAAVGDLVGDEPFCWMGNTDLSDSFFAQPGAARLPNTPHGLNSFQSYHNVVVLSALNPPPAHFGFMEGYGINGEEMRTAHYRTAVYQAVMRCSIRNPDDATPKRVVVMDRDTALLALQADLGGEVALPERARLDVAPEGADAPVAALAHDRPLLDALPRGRGAEPGPQRVAAEGGAVEPGAFGAILHDLGDGAGREARPDPAVATDRAERPPVSQPGRRRPRRKRGRRAVRRAGAPDRHDFPLARLIGLGPREPDRQPLGRGHHVGEV